MPQIAGLNLRAMIQHEQCLVAAFYDHPAMAPVFDLVVIYQDDSGLTLSSNPLHDAADTPDGDIMINQPDLSPEQAMRLISEHDTGKPRRVIDSNNFVTEFERAYARKMDWKIKRGTISAAFARMSAQVLQGRSFSEQEIEAARRRSEADLAGLITEACLDNFFRQSRLDIQDWKNLRDQLLVVHERMDREEIVETLADHLEDDRELHLFDLSESLYDISGLELFRQINQTLPERQRIIEMGTVEEPVAACICMLPT
jgi:hypothetical protein